MTVSNTQIRVSYLGDGASTNFPIPFPFYLDTDISVFLGSAQQSSGYSITGGEDANGNPQTGMVIFSSAPVSQVAVQFLLDVPLTQLVNLVDGTAFPSKTLNQVNDRAIQAVLRLSDQFSRTISAPDGDVSPNLSLPAAQVRANTYPVFDAGGNLTVAQSLPSGTLSQSTIGAFLNPITPTEQAAGVVIANPAYAPGDVRRYGADPTGNADSATAFNYAHSVVGANVVYPLGTFKIGSNLNPPRCASIMGAGGYLFGGTCIKPTAAVTKLFSITSTGGNYPEYIGRFSIDGTATTNATGMVFGDSSGAVHVDVANLYVGNFTGASGFGIKVADTLQSWFRHVYAFGNGTNWQLLGDTGFPTSTTFVECQADTATAGQGFAILSGYDIVFEQCIFQASTAEGCKIIPPSSGVCRNIVFNQPWFEANHAAYHLVVDGTASGAVAQVRLNEPYFAVGSLTALSVNATGAGADVLIRAPSITASLANNFVFQNSAFGRIDQWDNFWSYTNNVTDSAGKVMGWEGPLNTWNPAITIVGGSASLSGISISMARWRRVAVNLLLLEWNFTATNTGVNGAYLQIPIPAGFTLQGTTVRTAALVTDNGTEQLGAMLTDGAGNIRLYKANAAVYVAGTCGSTGQALLEIAG